MNFSKEVVKEVRKQIHYKRSDTVSNHLRTILQVDPLKYSGTVKDGGFVVWRYSQKCGIFYPVIHGDVTNREGKTSVSLYARLNPVGFIFSALLGATFFLAWGFGSQSGIFGQSLENWMGRLGGGLLVGSIPILSIRMIYGYEKRRELKAIAEMISAASETGSEER
jgi:hypothetical protein